MLPERCPAILTSLKPRRDWLYIVTAMVTFANASITQALKVIIDAT